MPVLLDSPGGRRRGRATGHDVIELGLINNLSDAGLEGGERQFVDLLTVAAGSRQVRIKFFFLPEIVRGPEAKARMAIAYQPYETLFDTHLDGLIVTGAEPAAARLQDERFWSRLTEVMDWAERETRSTVWSCLAAHAAVLHFDGIERRRLSNKCSGLYTVLPETSHPLSRDAGSDLSVCHSRYNTLDEADLTSTGYDIVTKSTVAGVDAFTKQGRSLSVFLQGHPEYDRDALFREYRRDVFRYLDGSSSTYPAVPDNYLPQDVVTQLKTFEALAIERSDPTLMARFPVVRRGASQSWTNRWPVALFSNWLSRLDARTAAQPALA